MNGRGRPARPRGPGRPPGIFLGARGMVLALWGLAFTHRLFLLLGSVDRGWPFPVFYEGDAETFFHQAMALLRGQQYDGGIPFHPPLFPLLLSALHGLLGNPAPNLALRITLAAVHALQVPLLWILLRRFLTPGAALAGALLATWSFGLSLLSVAAVSEGLYLLLLTAALLLFVDLDRAKDARSAPRWRAPGLGVLLGLLALTRAEGIGVALALLGIGAARSVRTVTRRETEAGRPARFASPSRPARDARLESFRPWGWAVLALAVTLAPWTIRNAVTLGRANASTERLGLEPLPVFVVTTAYGPLNFALANHDGAPGHFTRALLTSGLQRGVLDLHDPQHREAFLHGYRQGLSWIAREPRDYLALAGRKVALLARALRLGWTQWNLPGGLAGSRYPVDLLTPDNPAAVPVHLILLAVGTWMLAAGRGGQDRARGRAWLALTALLTGLTLLVTLAFFGYARLGVLLLPFLGAIEGAAVAASAGMLRPRGRMLASCFESIGSGYRFGRFLVLVVALVWVAELAGAFQGRDFIASGETQAGSTMLNRDSILRIVPK